MTSINVKSGNSFYASIDGVLYNKTLTTLVRYPCARPGDFTVPSGVASIGDYSFAVCGGLTSVTIQASVKSIGFQHSIGASP